MAGASGHQRLADIGAGADIQAKAVARVLMDEAHLAAEQAAPRGSGSVARSSTRPSAERKRTLPASGAVRPASEIEQGRLARARFADDRQHLAGPEREAQAAGRRRDRRSVW